MNLKQKLNYMLIGSLFTLAGYFLASCATSVNTPTPNVHAQDNTTKVFEKIVCKELEVVNNTGKVITTIGTDEEENGSLVLSNKDGKTIAHIRGSSDIMDVPIITTDKKDNDEKNENKVGFGGIMSLYNKDGEKVVNIGSNIFGDGSMSISNDKGNEIATIMTADNDDGFICVKNRDGEIQAGMTSSFMGGVIGVMNNKGERVVSIESSEDGGVIGASNKDGHPVAVIGVTNSGNGLMGLRNKKGKKIVTIDSYLYGVGGSISLYNHEEKEVVGIGINDLGGGSISLYNKGGQEVVGMGINKLSGGAIDVHNEDGIALTRMGAAGSDGAIGVHNKDGIILIRMGAAGGNGRIDVNSNEGKALVGIGSIKDRPNGIINVYNHKGDYRSYTAD